MWHGCEMKSATGYLYPPGKLCYNPSIEHTAPLSDNAPPDRAAKAATRTPIHAYDEQDRRFARAFDLVKQAIAEQVFPAASVAVTLNGKLVCLKAAGRFTYDAESPEVTPASIFDLASLTKVVATTSMAMVLYERGLLDLEMPVAAIVPQFKTGDPQRERITIRMLLAHSSGLPAYEKLFLRAKGREKMIAAACSTPLAAEPGVRAEYSDIGFIVLALALERIAGETLDCFSRKEIFGPSGMVHTGFNPPASWRSMIPPTQDDRTFRHRLIQGEVQDKNASALGGVAGHAGLFSPAEDLATFANVMLRGGRPIFRSETVALFTHRQASPASTSRALGWDTPSSPSQSGKYFSAASFGHLGYTGTSLWIDPERKLLIALLTNRTWPDCKNDAIKQFRPKFHDAIVEALEAAR